MAELHIDESDHWGELKESRVLIVSDRDDASARLYRVLNGGETSKFRNRVMARFGDGESDFKVIEPGRIVRFQFIDKPMEDKLDGHNASEDGSQFPNR
jgi:hypothetical protein